MGTKSILDDEQTFLLIMQLADIASAAHEREDYVKRDEALDQIKQLRKKYFSE